MKKKLALCTAIPDEKLNQIKEFCDISVCGELKHGKGNVQEAQLKQECMGNELIVLGDETAGADTIHEWAQAGHEIYRRGEGNAGDCGCAGH